jgi:hypothetical protein
MPIAKLDAEPGVFSAWGGAPVTPTAGVGTTLVIPCTGILT